MIVALSVYDLLLSFPMEFRFIWRGRFGTATILYVSIRYATIASMILETLQSTVVSSSILVGFSIFLVTSIPNL